MKIIQILKNFITSINCFFGIDNNTSATIFITLFIFILGFILTGLLKFFKNLIVRYKYRKYFRSLIKSIGKSSLKQSKYFAEATKTFDIKHKGNFTLKSGILTHLDNLDKIDFNLLYEAYFFGLENMLTSKIKIKAFEKTWDYCSQLKKIEERYPNQLPTFIQRFNELEDKKNESLTGFRTILDNIIHSTQLQRLAPREIEYVKALDGIMFEWQQIDEKERTHYYIVNEKVVQPIRKLNRTFKEIDVTLEMNNFLLGADHYYASMERLVENYHGLFKSYQQFYKTASKVLNICRDIL